MVFQLEVCLELWIWCVLIRMIYMSILLIHSSVYMELYTQTTVRMLCSVYGLHTGRFICRVNGVEVV